MRVLVFSDIHGSVRQLERIAVKHSDIETVIFLGDGQRDIDSSHILDDRTVYSVCGNCDPFSEAPFSRLVTICGKRIFMCHGQDYHVKWGTDTLVSVANARRADIALYGHTHIPECTYVSGMYLINPGSLGAPRTGQPSYAIIDITEDYILPNIIYV